MAKWIAILTASSTVEALALLAEHHWFFGAASTLISYLGMRGLFKGASS